MTNLDADVIAWVLAVRNARITAALHGTLGADASHVTGEQIEPPALPCEQCGALPADGKQWQIGEALTHYRQEHP